MSFQNNMTAKLDRILFYLSGAILFSLNIFIFSISLDYDFVSDDRINIVNNIYITKFSFENIFWLFTHSLGGHYQPITWISYMFDYSIWELNSFGYRLNNIIIHGLNGVLFMCAVFLILHRYYSHIAKPIHILLASVFGGMLFSIHPLRVESVVWVTERRDVLSTFFLLISFITYLIHKFPLKFNNISFVSRNAYAISFLFFIFSLLSKAWAITFPFVLLIIDFAIHYSEKITISKVISHFKNKIPFLLCSVIFIIIGVISAGTSGAMISWEKLTLFDRILQATYGFNTYLLHAIYPVELSPLYLLGNTEFFSVKFIVHFFIFILLFISAFYLRRKIECLPHILLIYFIIIFPVLGFAQSGPQMLADRYTYIALMPFAFALSWLMLKFCIKYCNRGDKYFRYSLAACFLFVVFSFIALTSLTFEQIKIWQNEDTLWSHAINVDGMNILAMNNRADFKSRNGMYRDSIDDYSAVLKLNHGDAYALNGRAASRIYLNEFENALDDLNEALVILPTYVDALLNRGVVYNNMGNLDLAKNDFHSVVELEPENIKGNFYLAIAFFSKNEFKKAIELFTHVYYLNPSYFDAIYFRGLSYAGIGKINEAVIDFEFILNSVDDKSIIYKNARNQLMLIKNG